MLRDNNSLTIVSKSGSTWGALGSEVTSIPSFAAVGKLFILLKVVLMVTIQRWSRHLSGKL